MCSRDPSDGRAALLIGPFRRLLQRSWANLPAHSRADIPPSLALSSSSTEHFEYRRPRLPKSHNRQSHNRPSHNLPPHNPPPRHPTLATLANPTSHRTRQSTTLRSWVTALATWGRLGYHPLRCRSTLGLHQAWAARSQTGRHLRRIGTLAACHGRCRRPVPRQLSRHRWRLGWAACPWARVHRRRPNARHSLPRGRRCWPIRTRRSPRMGRARLYRPRR